MKFNHLFLGPVTLAENRPAEWASMDPDSFVVVVDSNGVSTTAKVRALEPIFETEIPATHRSLNTLADEIREVNISKGWETPGEEPNIDQMLLLAVGEIAEAQEELRHHHEVHEVYFCEEKPGPQGFGIEIADTLIRLLHLCSRLDLDIDALVRDKLEFNKTRPFKHGGKAF